MNIIGPGSLHGLNVFVFLVGQGGPRLGISVLPQVKFPENFFLLRGNHAALMQFAMAPPTENQWLSSPGLICPLKPCYILRVGPRCSGFLCSTACIYSNKAFHAI